MEVETIRLASLPGNRISPSGKGSYLTCPHQYEMGYRWQVKRPPAYPLVQGTACHAGWGFAAQRQMSTGVRPPLEKILAVADQAVGFEIAKAEAESGRKMKWGKGQSLEGLRANVQRATRAYEEEYGRFEEPAEVEKLFNLPLYDPDTGEKLPWEIAGKLDQYGRDGFIRDKKVTGRRKGAMDALTSSQLTWYQIYVEASGRPVMGLGLDVVVVNSSVTVERIDCPPRTAEQKAAEIRDTMEVIRGIRARVFPRVSDWQVCLRRCGYLDQCRPDWTGGNDGNGNGS